MAGCSSLVTVTTARLEALRLWMHALIVLIVSVILRMCLDCSAVVALMNTHSHLRLLLVAALIVASFSVMDVAKTVEVFSISLCIIRKPTALMVDAMSSVILLSRATVKRMFASLVIVVLLIDVMRAFWTR